MRVLAYAAGAAAILATGALAAAPAGVAFVTKTAAPGDISNTPASRSMGKQTAPLRMQVNDDAQEARSRVDASNFGKLPRGNSPHTVAYEFEKALSNSKAGPEVDNSPSAEDNKIVEKPEAKTNEEAIFQRVVELLDSKNSDAETNGLAKTTESKASPSPQTVNKWAPPAGYLPSKAKKAKAQSSYFLENFFMKAFGVSSRSPSPLPDFETVGKLSSEDGSKTLILSNEDLTKQASSRTIKSVTESLVEIEAILDRLIELDKTKWRPPSGTLSNILGITPPVSQGSSLTQTRQLPVDAAAESLPREPPKKWKPPEGYVPKRGSSVPPDPSQVACVCSDKILAVAIHAGHVAT
jgi:hypothetical protein